MSISISELETNLQQINEYEFEEFVAEVWCHRGWNTRVTQGAADKGIDVVAEKDFPYEEKILIQAKRYGSGSRVGSPEMQKYASLVQRDKVDKVLIVCTSNFTSQAQDIAKDFGIKCVNGRILAQIIQQEGLEDLVREYVGEIDDAQIDSPTPATASVESEDDTDTTIDAALYAEGEHLTMELTGLSYSDRLSRTIATFEIHNKADSKWKIDTEDFTVISKDGFSHNPLRLRVMENIPGDWGMVYEDIRPDAKIRYLAAFNSDIVDNIERIEYDAPVRKRLSGASIVPSSPPSSPDKDASLDEIRKQIEKRTANRLRTETLNLMVTESDKQHLSIPDSLPIEEIYIQ
ncbi:restriction endonuclease [Natronosalvus caseinilyticus]|uniref:restriction endonuclease n=1 Tax=Natronosalvus caseinilyticus TaxID=2953747 RepID=UPI0028AC1D14|nr:restriction endonuclease [Natronosalvus caseinilyticus]